MEQRARFPSSLLTVYHAYPDALDRHKAQGLVRFAWLGIGVVVLGGIGLIINNASAFFVLQYLAIALVVIASMGAIVVVVNRGNLTTASILLIILTFVVALMAYIPNGPVSMF